MPNYLDEVYYLNAKVKELNADNTPNPYGQGAWTVANVRSAFADNGLTPEEHYKLYGRSEGLNPNPYFNEVEYLQAKLNQLNSLGEVDDNGQPYTIATLRAAIAKIGLTPAEHYEIYGAFETDKDGNFINPSNAFDANAYWSAKLLHVQNSGDTVNGKTGNDITLNDVIGAFKESGLSPVSHYMTYGKEESDGDNPTDEPLLQYVPDSQRVPADPNRVTFNEVVESNTAPATPQPDQNTGKPVPNPVKPDPNPNPNPDPNPNPNPEPTVSFSANVANSVLTFGGNASGDITITYNETTDTVTFTRGGRSSSMNISEFSSVSLKSGENFKISAEDLTNMKADKPALSFTAADNVTANSITATITDVNATSNLSALNANLNNVAQIEDTNGTINIRNNSYMGTVDEFNIPEGTTLQRYSDQGGTTSGDGTDQSASRPPAVSLTASLENGVLTFGGSPASTPIEVEVTKEGATLTSITFSRGSSASDTLTADELKTVTDIKLSAGQVLNLTVDELEDIVANVATTGVSDPLITTTDTGVKATVNVTDVVGTSNLSDLAATDDLTVVATLKAGTTIDTNTVSYADSKHASVDEFVVPLYASLEIDAVGNYFTKISASGDGEVQVLNVAGTTDLSGVADVAKLVASLQSTANLTVDGAADFTDVDSFVVINSATMTAAQVDNKTVRGAGILTINDLTATTALTNIADSLKVTAAFTTADKVDLSAADLSKVDKFTVAKDATLTMTEAQLGTTADTVTGEGNVILEVSDLNLTDVDADAINMTDPGTVTYDVTATANADTISVDASLPANVVVSGFDKGNDNFVFDGLTVLGDNSSSTPAVLNGIISDLTGTVADKVTAAAALLSTADTYAAFVDGNNTYIVLEGGKYITVEGVVLDSLADVEAPLPTATLDTSNGNVTFEDIRNGEITLTAVADASSGGITFTSDGSDKFTLMTNADPAIAADIANVKGITLKDGQTLKTTATLFEALPLESNGIKAGTVALTEVTSLTDALLALDSTAKLTADVATNTTLEVTALELADPSLTEVTGAGNVTVTGITATTEVAALKKLDGVTGTVTAAFSGDTNLTAFNDGTGAGAALPNIDAFTIDGYTLTMTEDQANGKTVSGDGAVSVEVDSATDADFTKVAANSTTFAITGTADVSGAKIPAAVYTVASGATLTMSATQANGASVTGTGNLIINNLTANIFLTHIVDSLKVTAAFTTAGEYNLTTAIPEDLAKVDTFTVDNGATLTMNYADAAGTTISGTGAVVVEVTADGTAGDNFAGITADLTFDVSGTVDLSDVPVANIPTAAEFVLEATANLTLTEAQYEAFDANIKAADGAEITMEGTTGDDTFTIDQAFVSAIPTNLALSIDGLGQVTDHAGSDTLDVDVTATLANVTGIEKIDLTATGAQTLTLDDFTFATGETTITLDAGDVVKLKGSWDAVGAEAVAAAGDWYFNSTANTLTYWDADLTPAADAVTVNLSGVTNAYVQGDYLYLSTVPQPLASVSAAGVVTFDSALVVYDAIIMTVTDAKTATFTSGTGDDQVTETITATNGITEIILNTEAGVDYTLITSAADLAKLTGLAASGGTPIEAGKVVITGATSGNLATALAGVGTDGVIVTVDVSADGLDVSKLNLGDKVDAFTLAATANLTLTEAQLTALADGAITHTPASGVDPATTASVTIKATADDDNFSNIATKITDTDVIVTVTAIADSGKATDETFVIGDVDNVTITNFDATATASDTIIDKLDIGAYTLRTADINKVSVTNGILALSSGATEVADVQAALADGEVVGYQAGNDFVVVTADNVITLTGVPPTGDLTKLDTILTSPPPAFTATLDPYTGMVTFDNVDTTNTTIELSIFSSGSDSYARFSNNNTDSDFTSATADITGITLKGETGGEAFAYTLEASAAALAALTRVSSTPIAGDVNITEVNTAEALTNALAKIAADTNDDHSVSAAITATVDISAVNATALAKVDTLNINGTYDANTYDINAAIDSNITVNITGSYNTDTINVTTNTKFGTVNGGEGNDTLNVNTGATDITLADITDVERITFNDNNTQALTLTDFAFFTAYGPIITLGAGDTVKLGIAGNGGNAWADKVVGTTGGTAAEGSTDDAAVDAAGEWLFIDGDDTDTLQYYVGATDTVVTVNLVGVEKVTVETVGGENYLVLQGISG